MTTVDRPATGVVDRSLTGCLGRADEGTTTIKTPLTVAAVAVAIAATGVTSTAAGTPRGAVAVSAGRGFHWGDAAVGAAASIGALLLLIGNSPDPAAAQSEGSAPALSRASSPLRPGERQQDENERSNDDHNRDQ
jgi:hypothetical protein